MKKILSSKLLSMSWHKKKHGNTLYVERNDGVDPISQDVVEHL